MIVYQYCKGIPITGEPDKLTMDLLAKDANKGVSITDIYVDYRPKNIEKGKGGGRLTDKSYLKEEDAITVAGFKMHKDAAVGWAFMIMNARWAGFGDEIFTIRSATRTKEEQTELWNNKITSLKKQFPKETQSQIEKRAVVYVANPQGGFPHETGRALDLKLSVGGTNSSCIEAQKETADYKWLVKNAQKYGFYNYEAEPWHWEYNPMEDLEKSHSNSVKQAPLKHETSPKKLTPINKISEEGIIFLHGSEGFSEKIYKCQAGFDTIGYGHKIKPGEVFEEPMSKEAAMELFNKDIQKYIDAVLELQNKYNLTFTQNQFDALVSFTYNLGENIWKADKSVLRDLIVSGEYTEQEIINAFGAYHKYKDNNGQLKKSKGLYNRRIDEAEVFLYGEYKRRYDREI